MKAAFATSDGTHIDSHFGWARTIAIYDVAPESAYLVESVEFTGSRDEDGNENKLIPRVDAIKDCALLYVAAIGGSAAARVVARGIHPVKVAESATIEATLATLRQVLCGNPPPWLRKAMNKGRERTLDFEEAEVIHG